MGYGFTQKLPYRVLFADIIDSIAMVIEISFCNSIDWCFAIKSGLQVSILYIKYQDKYKKIERKLWLFYFSSVLSFVLGVQKNRLIETVLLSTHNICFGWEIKKNTHSYLGTCSTSNIMYNGCQVVRHFRQRIYCCAKSSLSVIFPCFLSFLAKNGASFQLMVLPESRIDLHIMEPFSYKSGIHTLTANAFLDISQKCTCERVIWIVSSRDALYEHLDNCETWRYTNNKSSFTPKIRVALDQMVLLQPFTYFKVVLFVCTGPQNQYKY